MEIEATPPAENGNEPAAEAAKKPEESPPSDGPKQALKSKSRKRSRSRSVDVDKQLQVTLQQCDFEVNGNAAKTTQDETKEEKPGVGDDKPEKGDDKSVKGEEKPLKSEENGDDSFKRITRSQTTGDEEKKPEESPAETQSDSPKKKPKKQAHAEPETTDSDVVVIDEPEPELQFDSSDFDSVEGSPLITNSGLRRSQVIAVKTCLDFDDDKELVRSNDTTIDSQDMTNLSTRAVVGSDVTCATYEDEILPHDDSYFQQIREKSLSETLRSLSARKPIRSDYRRLAARCSFGGRSELNVGTTPKRKERSATPEEGETKRFKPEGPSLFASLRGRFGRSETAEGSPRLTGYRDRNNDLHFEEGLENGVADKKNWCNIM